MAFTKISNAFAIPQDATAEYTFYGINLCPAGPVTLIVRHAGDGTPGYKRASWNAAHAARGKRADATISDAKTRAALIDNAKLIADHCVVSWRNVFEDGATEPARCTPANVLEFLTAIIEAHEGIKTYTTFGIWAADGENFRPLPTGDAAELGKA